MGSEKAVENLIYKSCMLMAKQDFTGYLDLCDDKFHYLTTAHSPEIRKDMIWLEKDKSGMDILFKQLPRHNSDHSPLTRHATVYSVDYDEKAKQAAAITSVQIYRTDLDGGATALFAVGKYYDKISFDGPKPRLLERNVRLDTRMLGMGYHIPL